jgi:hypothetical protein
MKDFLADIMMKSENPDIFEYILYKKLHGKKSTVKKEEGVPPLTFTSSGFPLNSYEIFGNLVNGEGVGDRTENLFDASTATRYEYVITNVYVGQVTDGRISPYSSPNAICYILPAKPGASYTLTTHTSDNVVALRAGFYALSEPSVSDNVVHNGTQAQTNIANPTITVTNTGNHPYLVFQLSAGYVSDVTVIEGSTAPSSYIPYGYKIPVSCAGVITPIYIGANPLRKALDDSVFDELSSEGIIIRRVDDEGTPLAEPIVETVTCPVIETDEGSNTFDVDTTVTPSNVIIYHT